MSGREIREIIADIINSIEGPCPMQLGFDTMKL
jgi:hypothetical protein